MSRNSEFLNWIADRIVKVYGESENVDFVLRLRELARHAASSDGILTVKVDAADIAKYAEGELRVFLEIVGERQKQDAQWGGPSHDDEHDSWQFLGFINVQHDKLDPFNHRTPAPEEFRERFVKIAALAVAAIESIDRKTKA